MSIRRRRFLCFPLAGVGLNGCAAPPEDREGALLDRLRPARFALIGEVHDNAEHHRLQARLVAGLLADGRTTCVVFEQMDRGRDAEIAAAPREAEAVATAGALDRRGWAWPMHEPVLAAALAGGATVRGGNLSRDAARAVVRAGAVPAGAARLMSAAAWTPEDEAAVRQDIDTGHCGALPPALVPAMALAERARDATLAEAMLEAARNHGRVVLIAGNGHVRCDLGVPRYLLAAGVAEGAIVSVGLQEAGDPGGAPYDLAPVTAAAERPDPCDGLRRP